MDTTERITLLCDGDKCYQGSIAYEVRKYVTIGDLQREQFIQKIQEYSEELAISVMGIFRQIELEETVEKFKEFFKQLEEEFKIISTIRRKRPRWQLPKFPIELYHSPLLVKPRCRWRQRESHRVLSGLSPGIVIIDEYACTNERVEGSEIT